MAAVTRHEIYRAIIETIQTVAGLDDVFIHLAVQPTFNQSNDVVAQVVPGGAEAQAPRAGHGLVEEDFRVVVWRRLHLDQQARGDERLANDTLGIMATEDGIMDALIQSLPAEGASTKGLVFVRWIRSSSYSDSPDAPGWILGEMTFRIGYEVNWPTTN